MAQAKRYVLLRRGASRASARDHFLLNCSKNPQSDPYCSIEEDLKNREQARERLRHNRRKFRVHGPSKDKILAWIRNGDSAALKPVPDSEVRKSFRGMNQYDQVEKLADQILAMKETCDSADLGTSLAVKAEEFLPDEKIRKKVIELYERGAQCKDRPSAEIAHFRVSLMYLWEGQCEAAVKHLRQLEDPPSGLNSSGAPLWTRDYESRALYWQYQCAKQLPAEDDRQAAQNEVKKRLNEKFPFSFHALLIQQEEQSQNPELKEAQIVRISSPIHMKTDSTLQFQVPGNSRVNDRVKAVEALLVLNEKGLARQVMSTMDQEVEALDPAFRLYGVVLYTRMTNFIGNFGLESLSFEMIRTLFPSELSSCSIRTKFQLLQ